MTPNNATIRRILAAHHNATVRMAETIWRLQMSLWAVSLVAVFELLVLVLVALKYAVRLK
jgi:hypothetical protein